MLNRLGGNFIRVARYLTVRQLVATVASVTRTRITFSLALRFIGRRQVFNGPLNTVRGAHFALTRLQTGLSTRRSCISRSILLTGTNALDTRRTSTTGLLASRLRNGIVSDYLRLRKNTNCVSRCHVDHVCASTHVSHVCTNTDRMVGRVVNHNINLSTHGLG